MGSQVAQGKDLRGRIATSLIVFVSLFILGAYVLASFDHTLNRWWTDLSWTLASLLTALMCFRAGRGHNPERNRPWRLFGMACLVWFLGMLVWDYQELIQGQLTPFPGFSDIGFLLFVPLFSAGLITCRTRLPSVSFTLLEISQLGIFIACVVIAHLVVFYDAVVGATHSGLYLTAALAYPVLYMALLVQAIEWMWVHRCRAERGVCGYLVAGVAVHAVTNSIYAYELLGHRYYTGQWLDAAWIIGFALIVYAAAVYSSGIKEDEQIVDKGSIFSRELRVAGSIHTLVLVGTTTVVFSFQENLNREIEWPLLAVGAMLTVFLALREWASIGVREKLHAAMSAVTDQLQQMARLAPVGIFHANEEGDCVYVNEAWCNITGQSSGDALGQGWMKAIHPMDEKRVAREWKTAITRSLPFRSEYRFLRPDGRVAWVLAQASVERDIEGRVTGYVGTITDITERKVAEMDMQKLSGALQQTADAVMITNRNGVVEYVNPAFEAVTGYRKDEICGKRSSILKSGKQGEEFYKKMWSTILAGEVFSEIFVNKKRDGALYYEEKSITPIKDAHGEITHFVSTGRDITERMQTEERLRHLAEHDLLTDLPNRTLYMDRLKHALAHARWHDRLVAVMFLDIDRFKNINDTLGHEAGDQLIRSLAERLNRCLRERDTVARFGGDEFAILLGDIAASTDVALLAQKILDSLEPPFLLNGASFHITVSIGISLYPSDGEDSSTLLKNADMAMYRAKDLGRNNFQFYSAEMTARAFKRLTLENSLRSALEQDEFVLHYQPEVDIRTGEVVAVEALVRWNHPELGLVPPVEFIPLLEETGLIVPVGQWILETACHQLVDLHRRGWRKLRMAVNVSGRQFGSPDFVSSVKNALAKCQLSPDRLELEITESTLMHHGAGTVATLDAINALGVRLGIDDFGTGYSSLSYLRRFTIDTLKIDRSFVLDIPADPDDVAITKAIVVMAQSMRLDIIAEGVETEGQREFLQSLGCYRMQGYLFSRPLPAGALEEYLCASYPAARATV